MDLGQYLLPRTTPLIFPTCSKCTTWASRQAGAGGAVYYLSIAVSRHVLLRMPLAQGRPALLPEVASRDSSLQYGCKDAADAYEGRQPHMQIFMQRRSVQTCHQTLRLPELPDTRSQPWSPFCLEYLWCKERVLVADRYFPPVPSARCTSGQCSSLQFCHVHAPRSSELSSRTAHNVCSARLTSCSLAVDLAGT